MRKFRKSALTVITEILAVALVLTSTTGVFAADTAALENADKAASVVRELDEIIKT